MLLVANDTINHVKEIVILHKKGIKNSLWSSKTKQNKKLKIKRLHRQAKNINVYAMNTLNISKLHHF